MLYQNMKKGLNLESSKSRSSIEAALSIAKPVAYESYAERDQTERLNSKSIDVTMNMDLAVYHVLVDDRNRELKRKALHHVCRTSGKNLAGWKTVNFQSIRHRGELSLTTVCGQQCTSTKKVINSNAYCAARMLKRSKVLLQQCKLGSNVCRTTNDKLDWTVNTWKSCSLLDEEIY